MMEDQSWTQIQLENDPDEDDDFQTLLIKSSFSIDGYQVLLTDIGGRTWYQTTNRKAMITQGRKAVSMDLGDDDLDNVRVLVYKLRDAVQGERGTTRKLVQDGNDKLVLTVAAPLPGGMGTLKWTFQLQPSRYKFYSEFSAPLIWTARSQQRDMEDLITQLKQKDRVIDHLIARLGTAGLKIQDAIPAARPGNREEAAKGGVTGLGSFRLEEWKKLRASEDYSDISIPKAFASISPNLQNVPDRVLNNIGPARPTVSRPNSSRRTNAEDDDDFQRQATPPGLKPSAPLSATSKEIERKVSTSTNHLDDDDTTEDEDDLDSMTPVERKASPPTRASPKIPTRPKGKLGAVGGRKSAKEDTPPLPTPSSPPPQPTIKPKGGLGKIGARKAQKQDTPPPPSPPRASSGPESETESTEDEDNDLDNSTEKSTKSLSPPRPQPFSGPRKKGALGMIGKRKKAAVEAESSVDVSASSKADILSKHDDTTKMDIDKNESEAVPVKHEPLSHLSIPRSSQPPNSTQEREEKANERRQELKRKQEEAAANPKKKKGPRKF